MAWRVWYGLNVRDVRSDAISSRVGMLPLQLLVVIHSALIPYPSGFAVQAIRGNIYDVSRGK